MHKIPTPFFHHPENLQRSGGKPKIRVKVEDHLIPLGIGFGVIYWVLEAFIHTFIFRTGNIMMNMFRPDPNELWMRSLLIFFLILFSAYAQYIIVRRKRAERELQKYRDHLEELVKERTIQLRASNEQLQREIIERKRAEEATRLAYTELDSIFNASGDGMCVIGTDFKLLRVNDTFCTMLGISREETAGRICSEVLHHSLCKTLFCPLTRILSNEKRFEYDLELERNDGFKIPCILTATPLRRVNGDLAGMVETFKDMTDRRKMEEELQKSQKLESIGILAGGIAHDFNNMLTVVMGNISLGKLYAQTGKNATTVLTEAEGACLQAKSLTQQLLTFSKGGEPIRKDVSISKLLKDTATLALSGSKTAYKLSLPDDLWWGKIDEGQIRQVISNLIINADQAMPEGGLIEICAENTMISAQDSLPLKDGRYIKISVRDHGVGIPKKHLQKIFDPYFTTKQNGSGLGLAISYSIIKKHEGLIMVESEVEVGTVFSVYLPASEKEIFTVKDIVEENLHSGKGKVLLMDDQRNIREMVGETLTYLGYEVYCASEGSEAISLFKKAKEEGNSFDAVILDLTVPGGMGGKETVQALLKIDPEVKAIVSSGYSNDPVMSEYRQYGFSYVINKPFVITELSNILKKLVSH